MSKATYFTLFFSLFSIIIHSQERKTAEFGKPTYQEIMMTSYDKDPEASGVVLFEKGSNSIELIRNYILLKKVVHRKIKVLDAKKFDQGTVNIYLYKGENDKEKLAKIKAVTHNGNLQNYVKETDYFSIDESERWSATRFTFPNIKDGSILEYTYTIETPFFFSFGGWYFQGDLPKMYSEFNSEIPGNYGYNRALYGNLPLVINESKIKTNCFSLPYSKTTDCEVSRYALKDIPVFQEEDYMLAKSNYISRVSFELKYSYGSDGTRHKYSKTWKDVDKEFKNDKNVGRQLKSSNYFAGKIPEDILNISDDLKKAQAVYTFIQQHFTYSENLGIFSKARVKKAFDNKKGTASEINISLINALQAANLDAKLILHSTRENGLPMTSFPIISDFNYVLVLLTINDKEYILDATDKLIPFGIVPFKALNVHGRVMDFKKGSYWKNIIPNKKNVHYVAAQLSLDEEGIINGNVSEIYTGYTAIKQRRKVVDKNESEYVSKKENALNEVEITNYSVENAKELDKPLKEKFDITFSPETVGSKIYLFPYFLQDSFKENPFKLKDRSYPVDIGYPVSFTYILSLDLGDRYEVEKVPGNKKIKLNGDAGECVVLYGNKDGKLNLRFTFNLKTYHFKPDEYQNLKEFFNQVVEILTKEAIVLKKL